MISTKNASHLMVEQKPEIWVTDDISIKFNHTVNINSQLTLDIIEQASSILRTLEVVKQIESGEIV